MNVSGTGSATTPAYGAANGIGLEFVRPMGVPPYAPKPAETSASAAQQDNDGSAGAAASQDRLNMYGGGLDIKA